MAASYFRNIVLDLRGVGFIIVLLYLLTFVSNNMYQPRDNASNPRTLG
jgi:hypothetical protein